MAKSGVLSLRNGSTQPKQTSPQKPNQHLTQFSARPPPENLAVALRVPSPLETPFPDLTTNLVSSFTHLSFCSPSPPPSDDGLQSLQALRHNVENDENGYSNKYAPCTQNPAPIIECKHFLEVQDSKHRYGTYLLPYYDIWMCSASTDPFFKWLDQGEGRNADASKQFTARPHCVSRHELDLAVVHYCTEKQRQQYRVLVRDGKLIWASGNGLNGNAKCSLVETGNGEDRWIFVIDEHGNFYLNKKSKGRFHHSSFVSGRPVRAAGRIIIHNGDIESLGPNSGHYLTPQHQLLRAIEHFFGYPIEDVSALCARSSFEMDRL